MTEALSDILSLFASSFYGSLVVGAVCPVIGVFFVLRRVVFLGIAVPQFAAAGVAFGFVLLPLVEGGAQGGGGTSAAGLEGHFTFHLLFALAFTFLALFVLALLGRKGTGSPESRIAAGYAFAAALTVLFLSASAMGAAHVQVLLRGEILTLSTQDLVLICVLFGLVFLVFLLFHRRFLLVGYDREAAVSLGYRPFLWDALLYGLVGASIAAGVLTVGPLVIFGLMVIPPLAARPLAVNMTAFYLFSAAFGLLTSAGGFLLSYLADWPLGPTDVVLAFALLCLVHALKGTGRLLRAA